MWAFLPAFSHSPIVMQTSRVGARSGAFGGLCTFRMASRHLSFGRGAVVLVVLFVVGAESDATALLLDPPPPQLASITAAKTAITIRRIVLPLPRRPPRAPLAGERSGQVRPVALAQASMPGCGCSTCGPFHRLHSPGRPLRSHAHR